MLAKPDKLPSETDNICMGVSNEAEQNRLIVGFMGLVEPIAAEYRGRKGIPFDDLIASGREGLVKAARNYDASLAKFQTYATIRIRGHIKDFIDSWQHLIPVGSPDEVCRNFHEWDIWGGTAPFEQWTHLPVSPEDLLIAFDELNARKEALMRAWRFLPKMERKVIELRFFRDPPMPLNSIAREFEMPYATLVDFINRTLKRLAKDI